MSPSKTLWVRDAVSRPFFNKEVVSNADFTSPNLASQPNHLSPVKGEFGGSARRDPYHIVHARLSSY